MANANIVAHITRQNVGQALRQMRIDCRYDEPELNAINKAALELEAANWQYDGERLAIDSRTAVGKRYHVASSGCECKAAKHGRPCWHFAAWHLVRRAAEYALTQPKPKLRQAEYAAKMDEWNDGLF